MGQIAQNPYRERGMEWQLALAKKKKAALEMLEAQKVIEKIEAEAAEFVLKLMITCLCFQSYDIKDASSLDGRFITTISDILHTPAQA